MADVDVPRGIGQGRGADFYNNSHKIASHSFAL